MLCRTPKAGDRVRALLAELYGHGTTGPDWHDASRTAIPHVMLSDCRSPVANLNTEVPSRVQDKRLQMELDAIRQSIFDGDGRRTAEVYPKGGDRLDWPHKEHEANLHAEFWIRASTRSRARATPSPALEANQLYLRDRRSSSRPRPRCSRRSGPVGVKATKQLENRLSVNTPLYQSCVCSHVAPRLFCTVSLSVIFRPRALELKRIAV